MNEEELHGARRLRNRNGEPDEKAEPWLSVIGKSAMTVVCHPIDYARTLMQIGFEPLTPVPSHTIFWKPVLQLPNIFTYMGHIRRTDGFFGLYRGLGAAITGRIVYDSAFVLVATRLPPVSSFEEDQALATDGQKIVNFIRRTSQESAAYVVAIAAAQPLKVITVRMMAQIVGHEIKYTSVLGSLRAIYNEEGISGLWSGLLPKIYGEVLRVWIAATVAFFFNTYIVEDPTVRTYISQTSGFVASTLCYPFHLVSTVMSVSGAPIAAGGPPNVAIYSNWSQCYSHLKRFEQLKRGSSLFWRYHYPVDISNGVACKRMVDLSCLD